MIKGIWKFSLGLLTCLILFSLPLKAQVRLVNLSLKDSTVKEMYKGWANRIKILSKDKRAYYDIRCTHSSKVIAGNNNHNSFLVRSMRIGKDTLKLYNGKNFIGEYYFEVKKVPEFKAWIGFPNKSYLSKEQILNSGKLFYTLPSSNLILHASPIGFDIAIKDHHGNTLIEGHNRSFKIAEEYLEIIKTLKRNSSILFSRIKLYPSPDCGGARILSPLLVKIK